MTVRAVLLAIVSGSGERPDRPVAEGVVAMVRHLFHRGAAPLWAVPAASPPDAAAISRKAGDRRSGGRALNDLGIVLTNRGDFKKAIPVLHTAVDNFRESGDRHGEGQALGNLGVALREAGRPEEAIPALRDAAAIFRKASDRYAEGRALNDLGVALRGAGQSEEAITAFQDAARCPAKSRRLPRWPVVLAVMWAVIAVGADAGALVLLFEGNYVNFGILGFVAVGTGLRAWQLLAGLMARRPPFLMLR